MSRKSFLDKAYHISDTDGIHSLYAEWAESYEAEITENGYATPARMAALLAKHFSGTTPKILDFGCGTGLSGVAFHNAGFPNITGADPSKEMLAFANSKDLYADLVKIEVGTPPPFQIGSFDVIAAVGVIGTGAAPVEVLDTLLGLLHPGQHLILSFNDHTLETPEFPERLDACIDAGIVRLIENEYGDHLPGIGIKSMIYLLEKA